MSSKYLPIYDCNSNMRAASDITNQDNSILVAKGTVIDTGIIARLNLNNISSIDVYDASEDIIAETSNNTNKVTNISDITDIAKNKCTFVHDYFYSIGLIKKIMHLIRINDKFDASMLYKTGDHILNSIDNNSPNDILDCITKVQSPEDYTYIHSVNVSFLSTLIGKWLEFPREELKELAISGLLHDIGKSKIPFELINKPDKLTDEEFEELKKHSLYGSEIVENIGGFSESVISGILMHHERENGTGYPEGMKGDSIHVFGKILAITDIFSAMTSKKIYKDSILPLKALNHFKKQQSQELDSNILNLFIDNLSNCYHGKYVILNTGIKGTIETINFDNLERPIISAKTGAKDNSIDLSKDLSLEIVSFM